MATYTVETERPGEALADRDAVSFKYRYRSTDGHRTAQAEYDRRRRAGQRAIMTRWEHGQPRVVARWDLAVA